MNKYKDLAREMKKQWNMKVTVIPIVFGSFATVLKALENRLEMRGRTETIQTITLLKSARIPRRSEKTIYIVQLEGNSNLAKLSL